MRKLFRTFTEIACDKKNICRYGESVIGRTSSGWKFPEPTSLCSVSSGNFQPPSVRPIPDSPPCKYVCYQRRSDKQLASCHVSSRPMRSLYFPSYCLQNLDRKICIRRKINRKKILILKFS